MEITKVREICYTIAREYGFNLYCPVLENGRLKTTLGRVCYDEEGGLDKIEFSKTFLISATDENVISVVLHELAHAFVYLETGERHGHDKVFKAMCQRLGTSNDKTKTKVDYKNGISKKEIHKYSIFCKSCRKLIGYRNRACNVTKNPEAFSANCCLGDIFVVKNY